jgi:NTE family protein
MNKETEYPTKTALVLAGGGLTGAVYEIGALRAIDDLLINRRVIDFDFFVGTSAGALVAALLANGINPEQMMRSLDGSYPDVKPISRENIFNIQRSELLRVARIFPKKLASSWINYISNLRDITLFDFIWSLLEFLPAGFYDGMGLEHYVKHVIERSGISNRFNQIEKDLSIVATDLDSGRRKIFDSSTPQVPISVAVAASSAVPIVYRPVRIQGHDYIDGGVRGNASLDIAIEKGAKLVVCINPMVPFDNADLHSIPDLDGENVYLSDKGFNYIASQVTRIWIHSSIRYHVKQLRRSHPEVDIILVEPKPDDYLMFFNNPMRYSARLEVAQHGFESVTYGMAADYPEFKNTLARHGIDITRRVVIQQLQKIEDSNYDIGVMKRVFESRPLDCGGVDRNLLSCQLDTTLDRLERILEMRSGA